jgi:hypothetical protein
MQDVIHNPEAVVASPVFLAVGPGVQEAMNGMAGAFVPIIFFLFLGASIMFGLGFVLRLLNDSSKKPAPRGGRKRRRRVG